MNIRHLSLAAMCAAALSASAAVDIFPVPQQVNESGTAFAPAAASYRLTGANEADADAVAKLAALNPADGGAVEIVIGEAGDAAVASVASKIPAKTQGYYLSVTPSKVIIAGNDGEGTFYGVQSFLQLLQQAQVPAVEITDWPDNPVRGIVEGYYGNPWSREDRLDMMQNFMPHSRLNVYIYGPKDDPYHHGSMATEPYPADKAAELSELAQEGLKNKVHFVWAMHPGNAIEGDDRTKAVEKFNKMYDLGVRQFAVFFDDISNYDVNKQVEFLNHINAEVVKKHSDVAPLIVCPSQYNQAWSGNGDYHVTMGAALDSDIEVMWTGRGVVDIKLGDASKWFTEKSGRKPLIWENYPVNDYGYTVRPLLMSPYPAPDANISSLTTGLTSNPMEYYRASMVALYGMGDFAWNSAAYDDWQSWDKTLGFIMPDHKEALKTFCYSSFYYPGNTHGLVVPYEETPDFKALMDANPTYSAEAYEAYFAKQVAAGTELLEADSPLTAEIAEFLTFFKIQGERGQLLGSMSRALDAQNADDFVKAYTQYAQLSDSAANIVSRDFEGTIKRFPANCGNLYVEPFITTTANSLVGEFKASGMPYDPSLFPAQSIPDGNYLIKVNGAWLSNGSGAAANTPGNPTFRTSEDDINSARQAWSIRYDMNTGRFAIRSLHDNRYVNEKGDFGTNQFESVWHTYNILSLNGKFAIQNAGSAGNDFWTKQGTRIQKGSAAYSPDVFIFDIEAVGDAAPARDTVALLPVNTPVIILNDEGKILRRSGSNVSFVDRPASLTNNHKFIFVPNANGRFELRVASATRPYVNEKGVIGSNEFSADWNTYEVYERNGKFAIRNSVDVGNNSSHEYWLIDGDNLSITGNDNIKAYVFTIIDPDQTAIDEITVSNPSADAVFDLQGRRVANPTHGLYIVNGRKVLK